MKNEQNSYIVLAFVAAYYVPWSNPTFGSQAWAFMMLQEYRREHVFDRLIPAFFIAGAIAVFVSQHGAQIFRCDGNKILSYSVSIRARSCGLLLHGAAPFCRHLHEGRWDWAATAFCIPVLRSMCWPSS